MMAKTMRRMRARKDVLKEIRERRMQSEYIKWNREKMRKEHPDKVRKERTGKTVR